LARSDVDEVSAALSAYVLIQTEVGKVAHVAQALSDLDGRLSQFP
jgi:anthranilate/para-aminobenzoate synthase component I